MKKKNGKMHQIDHEDQKKLQQKQIANRKDMLAREKKTCSPFANVVAYW